MAIPYYKLRAGILREGGIGNSIGAMAGMNRKIRAENIEVN